MSVTTKLRDILICFFGAIKKSKKSKYIFYHDIHSDVRFTDMSTPVDLFEKHIDIIRENNLEIVNKITKEEGQIAISFDDGWRGLLENIDIINKYQVPVTIFIISSYLGKQNYISENELKDLCVNPLVSIQSHTHTHPKLSSLSEVNLKLELSKSRKILQEICGTEISAICYPKGLFSEETIKRAEGVGYKTQYSSIPGAFYDEVFNNVKRRSLVQFASKKVFHSILKGGDNFLSFWYELKHIRK